MPPPPALYPVASAGPAHPFIAGHPSPLPWDRPPALVLPRRDWRDRLAEFDFALGLWVLPTSPQPTPPSFDQRW